jgi:multisubunit Na+/H+ antiporter MnhE subunit
MRRTPGAASTDWVAAAATIAGMGRAGAVLEVAVWEVVLAVVYLATLASYSQGEVVVAVAAAFPAAVLARVARRASGARWQLPHGWWRWLALVPVAVLADSARLLKWFGRRDAAGQLRELHVPAEPTARTETRLAVAGLVLSATPASYVVDTRANERTLLVHALVDGRPRLEERVIK